MRGRIVRGAGAGALGQAINVASRLLLVPLFLASWGPAAYGEWLILSSAAAWLAMGDLGGQIYFVNRLTGEWARRAHHEFEQTLSTGFTLFIFLPGVLFVIFTFIALFVPIGVWMGLELTSPETATAVLLLLAFHIVITLPQGLLFGVYRATGAQATSIMLGNAILSLQVAASSAVLFFGGGPIEMAAAQLLPTIVVALWAIYDLRRRMPEMRLLNPRAFRIQLARDSLRPSLHFLGIQFAHALVIQGSVLAIGRALGSVEVAIFSTIRTLVNLSRQVLGLLSHSAWPEFTRLEQLRDYTKLNALFAAVFRLSLLASIAYMAVMETSGARLMGFWVQNRLPYDALSVRFFSIYVLLSVFWTLVGNVLMATNHHTTLAKWQLASSVVAVCFCYLGASHWGLAAGVAGLVLGEALPLCVISGYLLVRQHVGISRLLLIGEALLFGTAMLVTLVTPWLGWVVSLAIAWTTWKKLQSLGFKNWPDPKTEKRRY